MKRDLNAITCGKQQEAHLRRIAALPRLGWKQKNGFWISPHSGRRYDLFGAIDVEVLRGTFRREWNRAYNAKRPKRRRGARPRHGISSTLIEAAAILA